MRKKLHRVLVTGGAGFIGSEYVRQSCLNSTFDQIHVVDKLTYAGDPSRLDAVKGQFSFHKADIASYSRLRKVFETVQPDLVVHFAAETHVDRSLLDVEPFIAANIQGTQNLIRLSREFPVSLFAHISTDEVYGESQKGRFKEDKSFIKPGNPYSATKASAEHLIRAAIRTDQFPAVIIRPANNYGPWQYPEKFIPVIIFKALHNQKVPVYGRGLQIREWLHVSDCAKGIQTVIEKGEMAETYNIGSYYESPNIETVKYILKNMKAPVSLIQYVPDRPGHDFRYSVDCAKLRRLGWRPQMTFESGMQDTLNWYLQHQDWLSQKREFLEAYWKTVYRV